MKPHLCSLCFLTVLGVALGRKQLRAGKKKPLSAKLKAEDSPLAAVVQTPWHDSLNSAASGEADESCGESPMLEYVLDLVNEMGHDVFDELTENGLFDVATYIKAVVDSNEEDEFIGKKGKVSNEHRHYHKRIRSFWDSTDDIEFSPTLLLGMHGNELESGPYFEQILRLVNPNATRREVEESATHWRSYIETTIGYGHPLLTFNAVAVSWADTEHGEQDVPDKIIIGDGMLSFVEKMGMSKAGRAYIHAHEFAHHIQFDLGTDERRPLESPAEESRRDELMADALAAYYLSHTKGENLALGPICEVYDAAVAVGDCDSESEGHHGTPSQRECAAKWGALLADKHHKVMNPSEFIRRFDANLEKILVLDQDACPESDPGESGECEFLHNGGVNAQISETAAEVLKGLFQKMQHG